MSSIQRWKAPRLRRRIAIVTAFGLLMVGIVGAPARAAGTYNNADIATDGLADLGQNPAPGGGQCKPFVNAMVHLASGGTQSPSGYQTGWQNAGGVATSSADAAKGDIIQITPAGSTDRTAESLYDYNKTSLRLHTAIIVSNNGNNSFTVVDANFTSPNTVGEHTFNPFVWASGSIVDIWRMGTVPTPPPGGSGPGTAHHADLAWFANTNHLYTFTGSALGTTGDASPYYTPTWAGVGDYNKDGKDDLFLYDGPTSTIYWASSDGTGVGTHGMAAIRGPGVGAPDWAAVGDFTGDGHKDSLAWFVGNTLYTFSGSCLCTTGTVTGFHAPTWGGVANYDHGGRDGLILYDAATTTIYWMSSNGSAVGANGIQAIRGPGVGAPSWAGVGDFTGSGYRDSLAWFANTNHLYTFSGSGLGTTGDVAGYTTPTWAGVGDYNHDGKDDLILYDGPTTTLYWMSSNGSAIGSGGMAAIRGPGVGAPSWAGVGNFEGG